MKRVKGTNSPGPLATWITARNLFIINLSFSLNLKLDEIPNSNKVIQMIHDTKFGVIIKCLAS